MSHQIPKLKLELHDLNTRCIFADLKRFSRMCHQVHTQWTKCYVLWIPTVKNICFVVKRTLKCELHNKQFVKTPWQSVTLLYICGHYLLCKTYPLHMTYLLELQFCDWIFDWVNRSTYISGNISTFYKRISLQSAVWYNTGYVDHCWY